MIKAFKQPINLLILVNLLGFALLFFYREPLDYNVLYVGGSMLFITAATYCIIYFNHLGDEYLFLIISMMMILGVIMICRLDYTLGIKQIFWYVISIGGFYAALFFYKLIKNLAKLKWLYFFVSIGLYVLTLAIGVRSGGAQNWIVIAGHYIQPAEFIRILYVLFLACYFSGDKKGVWHGISEKYIINLCAYVFMGFLLLQREWGITVLFFIIYMFLEYIYECDFKLITANALIAAIGGCLGYMGLYHIQVRVQVWLDPWTDVASKGYQIAQSLFAMSAGGWFGSGVGLGRPDLIPAVSSDFIFSAICEEMGMFGGVALILLYFIFAYRGMKIALMLPDSFDKCVVIGITAMFAVQTFIIIGGVIKMIPMTGITLPFVSYGGSSLLSSFIALGVMQAISMKRV